jgi:site-specific DNA-methyltransferase (adenine-specific)
MKYIKDKSIDMILCDLPYGTTQCKWDTIIPFDKLWEQYNRIIKDNGVICLFGSEPFASYLRLSNIKDYKYDWVWEKSKATNFLNAKKQPLRKIEIISVFYKKQPIYNPQMIQGEPYERGFRSDKYSDKNRDSTTGTYGSTFIGSEDGKRYPVNKIYFKTAESEGKILHPTQKPIALCEYLINTYTNEKNIVLDNCIGSGTTAIACMNLNRNYIGFENDNTYFNLATERINNHNIISI